MGFAVAGHAGNCHILHAAPDAVLLQHVEHVVKGGIVGNDADMVAAGLQRFQRFQNVAPQLPVVIGHLPEIGQLLRNGDQLFPIETKFFQIVIRPDLLRLLLQFQALAPALVFFQASHDPAVKLLRAASRLQTVRPQGFLQRIHGLRLGLLIVPDVL